MKKIKYPDTMDKIVNSYFTSVCAESFKYKGKEYHPHPLVLSPLIFREVNCPSYCGACCQKFTLDYLPSEKFLSHKLHELEERFIEFNGNMFLVYSDVQHENSNHHCANLDMQNGRCKIYETRPFSCDFELLRFSVSKNKARNNYLHTRLYGRGWALLKYDGERGALCEVHPSFSSETIQEIYRKIERLKNWCEYFDLKTNIYHILRWIERGPRTIPLTIFPRKEEGCRIKSII